MTARSETRPRKRVPASASTVRDAAADMAIVKLPTGIQGFDEISGGGLRRGRATVVSGAAGTGKTIFAVQTLCNAARDRGEIAIFVSFEERPSDLVRNLAGFGWSLQARLDQQLFFVDGRLPVGVLNSGDTDLSGLLAAVGALAARVKASWVVFDSVDAMLATMADDAARRRELARIHAWIEGNGLTCIVTAKRDVAWGSLLTDQAWISYLVDCVIDLEIDVVDTLAQRSLRIVKYRGSAHYDNKVPCLIGAAGFQLAPVVLSSASYQVFADRLSTGIAAFDAMLGGGILRGSAVLVTGAPGTAKTSICGRFVEAHCTRGGTALVVCFDEGPEEMVRNLRSIGVDLQPHVVSGRLQMHGMSARWQSADLVAASVQQLIERHAPSCVVVDPISALLKGGGKIAAMSALLQIFQLCKMRGVTLLLPCILSSGEVDTASSDIHASTVADVWIDLSYLVRAGERNRLLTVVKARGTAHSNQVREMILSEAGIELTAPYTEEGEVLTGTLRWQKEQQVLEARANATRAEARAEREFESATSELAERIGTLQRELEARNAMAEERASRYRATEAVDENRLANLLDRRGGGQAVPTRGPARSRSKSVSSGRPRKGQTKGKHGGAE